MNILFLGGDSRQEYASQYLRSKGYNSCAYIDFAMDEKINREIEKAQIIVLPLPLSLDDIFLNISYNPHKIKLLDLLNLIGENKQIIAGKLSKKIYNIMLEQKHQIIDYYNIEYFQIMNALLTAEGAIYYAKSKYQKSIYNSNIAILGFGKIARILAYLLHFQGAHISIIVRKESDLAWSNICGFNPISINQLHSFNINQKSDIIFNTIPYNIMDKHFCDHIDSNTLIFDLASAPYGINESLLDNYKIQYFRESGIPGRYAPKSSGEIIAQTIIEYILTEEG